MSQKTYAVSQEINENSNTRVKKATIIGSILIVLLLGNLDAVIGLFSDADLSFLGFLGIPFALIAIWVISRIRKIDKLELGFKVQDSKKKTILLGIRLGLLIQLVGFLQNMLFLGLGWLKPNYSSFSTINGDIGYLIRYLIVAWTTAGIGEEIIWRGFMMGQISQLFADKKKGMIVGLIARNVLFGLVHLYQGLVGVILTGTAGLLFGIIYIKSGKNLWLTVVVHITCNTFIFVLMFFL